MRRNRWASIAVGLGVGTALLSSCSLTEDRHFGVSRSEGGDLSVWFVNCYAAPWSVSLYDVDSDKPLWNIQAIGDDPADFPHSLAVGGVAPGYQLAIPLRGDPPPDANLKLGFSRGEAFGEFLTFRVNDLPADGSILSFDERVMTPDEFTGQRCEDE